MTIEIPPFSSNVDSAETLPSWLYTDPAVFELERERIFSCTWQPVGRLEQVETPGSYFTADVAGEPIVVLRDSDGILRAFYNVCRHRAGPVAALCGKRQTFTCRYHGWTYSQSGALRSAPEFDDVPCFRKEDFGLRPIAVDVFGPLLFVNLAASPMPLAKMIDGIPQATERFKLARLRLCERVEYEVACNRKVYIDNYLEGYHIPVVHPSLYRELDYANYRVETARYYSSQIAPLRKRNDPSGSGKERLYSDATGDAQALYYWVFPGWMLNVYPDNLQCNAVIPLSVSRTRVVFEWYMLTDGAMVNRTLPEGIAHSPNDAREAIRKGIEFGDLVQKEDIEICEAVQKGLGSRSYDRGRFCGKRENGVHHFQSLVHEFLLGPQKARDEVTPR
ncbi:MAG: aromatic ring-hydroxylating dioxygenase subunit alpha [Polyangia bacterium]